MLIFIARFMGSACKGWIKHPALPGAGGDPLGHYDPSAE
jgi:hypothetical protein